MSSALWRCALGLACLAAPACAQAQDVDLLSAQTLSASADLRAVAADGERTWVDGGFGKVRYGDGTGDDIGPQIGNADVVWQPRLGWSLSATVAASFTGGPQSQAGISEAFVTIKPAPGAHLRFSARLGFVWAPLSLEHEGADWHVADTITPSAINSWVGEELRPLTAEANATFDAGATQLTATAAVFGVNETAGTLLSLRGWALHDRKTLIGHAQPLPVLQEDLAYVQPRFTHPTLAIGKVPGYYLKLVISPPLPVRLELFHYDNRADPEDVNADLEWGWRTRFDQLGLTLRLAPSTDLRVQAMNGTSRMGFPGASGRIWVDTRFRSAFALVSHDFGIGGLAVRGELFDTSQRGSMVPVDDSERGWAATIAAHRSLTPQLGLWLEGVRVESRREARLREGLRPWQAQNQAQLVLRAAW